MVVTLLLHPMGLWLVDSSRLSVDGQMKYYIDVNKGHRLLCDAGVRLLRDSSCASAASNEGEAEAPMVLRAEAVYAAGTSSILRYMAKYLSRHAIAVGQAQLAISLMCNLQYFELRARLGEAMTLLPDFRFALASEALQDDHRLLRQYQRLLMYTVPFWALRGEYVYQYAFAFPETSAVYKQAESLLAMWTSKVPWLEWRNKPAALPSLLKMTTDTGAINFVQFSRNGRYLASTSANGSIRLLSADTTDTIAVLQGHAGPVVGAAFSPDGSHLVSVDNQGFCVWQLSRLNLVDGLVPLSPCIDVPMHRCVASTEYGGLTGVSYLPNGSMVAISHESGVVAIYNAASLSASDWKGVEPSPTVLSDGNEDSPSISSIAASSDSMLIMTGTCLRHLRRAPDVSRRLVSVQPFLFPSFFAPLFVLHQLQTRIRHHTTYISFFTVFTP
jgi:hypothetical protein